MEMILSKENQVKIEKTNRFLNYTLGYVVYVAGLEKDFIIISEMEN